MFVETAVVKACPNNRPIIAAFFARQLLLKAFLKLSMALRVGTECTPTRLSPLACWGGEVQEPPAAAHVLFGVQVFQANL